MALISTQEEITQFADLSTIEGEVNIFFSFHEY